MSTDNQCPDCTTEHHIVNGRCQYCGMSKREIANRKQAGVAAAIREVTTRSHPLEGMPPYSCDPDDYDDRPY